MVNYLGNCKSLQAILSMASTPKDSQYSSVIGEPMNRNPAPSVVLSVVTGPFLVVLLGARAIADTLTQVGIASEELFRGERLPIFQTPPEGFIPRDEVDAD
jgi:hypothetical protein